MGERHKITPEERAKSHASRRAKKISDEGLSPMEMVMNCRNSLYRELMVNPSASGAQAFVTLTKLLSDMTERSRARAVVNKPRLYTIPTREGVSDEKSD